MIEYDKLYQEVKSILSEKRFNHSIGVVERACEYAKIYNEDLEKVKLTAIAHDIAKEIPKDEMLAVAEKMNIILDEIEKQNLNLLHSKIGAEIVKQKYDFTEEMCNAIKYHTTGSGNMTMLEKIIFLADATEPNRNYEDLEWYVNLIKKDIDKGIFAVSKWCLEYLLQKEELIHENTLNCYNYYKK